MRLTFTPESRPYPRWLGPFSPARGTRTGFRFHQGRLGTWVSDGSTWAFWSVQGANRLASLVRREWGGGRVLLLPNGYVVKPLRDLEVGRRVVVGSFLGSIVLEKPEGGAFDLGAGSLVPGGRWLGPSTTGLECAIDEKGALKCRWYHPAPWGREEVFAQLRGADRKLALCFRRARPGATGGRVRVTANGHVITNRQEGSSWTAYYVGWVDPATCTGWDQWVRRSRT